MEQKNLFSYFQSFLKKNLAYSVSIIFERSIVFLLLPFYTNILSPAEYGIYSILISTISIFIFVISLGIENGLLKMTAETDNPNQLNSTTFWGMVLPGTVFTLMGLALSEKISFLLFQTTEYSILVQLTALILFADNITRFFLFGEIGEQRSKVYFFVSLSKGLIILGLNIYLVAVLRMGLEGVFYSYLYTSFILAAGLLIFYFRKLSFSFDPDIFKRIFAYGLPVMLTSVFFTLLNFFDTYLLQYFKGSQAVGEYSASYKLGLGMQIIITGFNMAAIPFSSHILRERPDDKKIFPSLLSFLFSVMVSIFIFVTFFLDEIVKTKIFGYSIIASEYHNAIDIIPVILFSYLCYGIYMNFSLPYYQSEKTKDLAVVSGSAVIINIILNLILIPSFSYWGSAAATLVSFFSLMLILFVKNRKDFKINYNLKFIVIFSLAVIAGSIIVMEYFRQEFLIKLGSYILCQIIIIRYLFKIKKAL